MRHISMSLGLIVLITACDHAEFSNSQSFGAKKEEERSSANSEEAEGRPTPSAVENKGKVMKVEVKTSPTIEVEMSIAERCRENPFLDENMRLDTRGPV